MATIKVTPDMVERAVAQADWAAQDALTDVDIARQVAADPDAAAILTNAQTAALIVTEGSRASRYVASRIRRTLPYPDRHPA